MSAPTRRIPPASALAFNKAMAERLGLDVEHIGDDFRADWTVEGGEELGRIQVSFTAYLPADEILAMFNASMALPTKESHDDH